MKNFLRRLRHWLRKPTSKNCDGICLICNWFEICVKDTTPELKHQDQPEHTPYPKEFRCTFCKSRYECPAYNTGVVFPCAYFKEEHHEEE